MTSMESATYCADGLFLDFSDFIHSIHTLSKQYSGSTQGDTSLLTLGTPWLDLG